MAKKSWLVGGISSTVSLHRRSRESFCWQPPRVQPIFLAFWLSSLSARLISTCQKSISAQTHCNLLRQRSKMKKKAETTLEQPVRHMFSDQLFYFFFIAGVALCIALPLKYLPHIIIGSIVGYWFSRVRSLLSSSQDLSASNRPCALVLKPTWIFLAFIHF